MLASVNEYHSRNMSDEIKRKTLQKVMDGGTPSVAPLGYKNVGEGGRRYVVVDPEPAKLITWCFEADATGEWTVKSLLAEVTARGLKSRGGPNTPKKELSVSQLHRILTKPYYIGIVTYRGVDYAGKHEPIVDQETWDRVQEILASNRNGLKQREHPHYLKGTIFFGHCNSRLAVTYARSKTGKRYPYYLCLGRHQKRTSCTLRSRPIPIVEAQIEALYERVVLDAEGIEQTGQAVFEELAAEQEHVVKERSRLEERLRRLDDERVKLLQAHYADAVPMDLLRTEQERIATDIASTEKSLLALTGDIVRVEDTIARATHWSTDCRRAYAIASHQDRKLINQAFFKRILLTEDRVVGYKFNEPFAVLMAAHGAKEGRGLHLVEPITPDTAAAATDPGPTTSCAVRPGTKSNKGYKRVSPSLLARAYSVSSLKATPLAERVGFEPTDPGGSMP